MNKKLVAVAVAGVLAAPLAAQAQTANVTLYGRLNLTAEVVNAEQADGTKGNYYQVSSNSSRLGVRGTESLGGGLNAIFQIESNVSADTGGGLLGTRETFVGLQGSWGTAKIGNFLAPLDDIHPIFGNVPTLTTSLLSTASVWAQGGLSKTSGGFDARLGNSVRYDSPNISGFTGSAQISQLDASTGQGGVTYGNVDTQRRHAYVLSMGGFYNNGPIQAGIAYEANNKVRGPNLNDYDFSVAGAYNFGVFRLGGIYERLQYDVPTGNVHRDYFGISGTFNLGPGQVYAYYAHAQDGSGSACDINEVGCTRALGAVGGVAKGDNTGANEWELSYTYPLSKRTLTYVGYHQIDNNSQAGYNFNINPIQGVPAAGFNAKGFVVGIVHFF
ncbi:MAG: porin [Proteobacteria bacterium]|nr:porin [Pseudomonadota bacterium]